MTTLKEVRIGNGSIQFMNAVEPTPASRETTGNVTIVNEAKPGSPAYFQVSFMIDTTFENGGIDFNNIFHWTVVTDEKDYRAAYRSVEDRAARLIAPMLRSLADKIEADLPDFLEKPEADLEGD
jgi:hypothetical protein